MVKIVGGKVSPFPNRILFPGKWFSLPLQFPSAVCMCAQGNEILRLSLLRNYPSKYSIFLYQKIRQTLHNIMVYIKIWFGKLCSMLFQFPNHAPNILRCKFATDIVQRESENRRLDLPRCHICVFLLLTATECSAPIESFDARALGEHVLIRLIWYCSRDLQHRDSSK